MHVSIADIEWESCLSGAGIHTLASLDDWFSPGPAEGRRASRNAMPGSVPAAPHVAEKTMTLRGLYRGSRGSVDEAKARLSALIGGTWQMIVRDDAGTTERMVEVARVDIPDDHGRSIMRYALDLVAHDPRRYAPAVTVTAGTRVHNDGTAPTSPVITLAGPSNTSSVYCQRPDGTQDSWFSVAALKAGEVLRVDCDSGVVTLNGLPSFAVRHPQFPVIPPGETRYFTADSGVLAVEFRSAWW